MSDERTYPTFYEWPSYFSPPDVDDGPPDDDRYPESCCQDCGTDLAFMGYSGSPEDTYEVYACPKCDLPKPPWTPAASFSDEEIARFADTPMANDVARHRWLATIRQAHERIADLEEKVKELENQQRVDDRVIRALQAQRGDAV